MYHFSNSLLLFSLLIYDNIEAHNLRDQCELNYEDNEHYPERLRSNDRSTTHVFKEATSDLSLRSDIVKKERMLPTYDHEVIFQVQHKNEDEIKKILHDVSDPVSAKYGQYLSREEVAAVTDNPTSRRFVTTYLEAAGATLIAQTLLGEFLTATAPISVWEELLDTKFYEFHYTEDNNSATQKFVRTNSYSVPVSLDKHVASIFNTIQMPTKIYARPIITRVTDEMLNSTTSIRSKLAAGFINPAILKDRYNVGNTKGGMLATQAAYETIGQYFSPSDLKTFQKNFMLEEETIAFDVGGHSSDAMCITAASSCVEANLDIQYIMAMSPGSPTTHWYTNSNSFAVFLVAIANIANPPLVISISYGADEKDMSRSEYDAFNFQAMKLGVMGITILAASGDDGASSYMARGNLKKCGYMPLFPATSPYVTAVGGTQVNNAMTGVETGTQEIACQSDLGGGITSGGGFSDYFPRPAWQSEVVSNYFAKVAGTSKEPAAGYNKDGRGYPDISAAAAHYLIFIGGVQYSVSGTSAATPVMAGMFSLVNAARLAVGKSPMGWANPAIYRSHQYYTNDVVSGKNNCPASSFSSDCCQQGFSAVGGWDPVTGLGSINFTPFLDLMKNLEEISTPSIITSAPTREPTRVPTTAPTLRPTNMPTLRPSPGRTDVPTQFPTSLPTSSPTTEPTLRPSSAPTSKPNNAPFGTGFGNSGASIRYASSPPTTLPAVNVDVKTKKKGGKNDKKAVPRKNTKGKGKGKK